MRPPAHWHLRRRRTSPLRWAVVLGASLLALVAVVVWRWPSGDAAEPVVVETADCTGVECAAEQPTMGPAALAVRPPKIAGRSAAVLEASCGVLIYGLDEHQRLPPASLAKIATALVAVERADLSQVVDVQVNSALLVASTASTVMGLQPGLRMSIGDLLHGLLLPSGNDAAIAIAEEVAGTEQAFVDLMNQRVRAMGLRDTNFSNSHGLDQTGLYSSAFDMAMLGRSLLAEKELAEIVRLESYQPAWDGPQLWNGNALLGLYPEAVGVKIGYTEKAGQTIVAAAERDGRRLIVAVFSTWDRYSDAIALFEWAFAQTEQQC